jgi:hypothetical protein
MNANRTLLAIALSLLFSTAQAQHNRLVDAPADAAQPAEASAQPAQHVEAEHLSEVSLATEADADSRWQAPTAAQPETGLNNAAAPVMSQHTPRIGDATRGLLQLQASGRAAAPLLPMLGEPANAAYKRHLDSFSHPIPEFFDTAVPSSTGTPQ